MKKSKINTPVMILFFNRPETLKEVFEAVKRARPRVLLLAQDGARPNNPHDLERIQECRQIVSDVDWECQILTNYAENNLTCDHREFTAISWAFSIVDRLIILEDDCVPCDSFFPFCDELLEKYKDDSRVDRISGYNRLEKYDDIQSDYFFSTIAAGYGWATWKRVWDQIEKQKDYSFLDDVDLVHTYNQSRNIIADKNYGDILAQCESIRKKDLVTGKIHSWELLVGVNSLINGSLIITPRCNMVKNIGATADATHYTELRYSDSIIRRLLCMDTYDVSFPLKHPNHVLRDGNFERKHYKAIHRSLLKKCLLKMEVLMRRVFYGDIDGIKKAVVRRMRKER